MYTSKAQTCTAPGQNPSTAFPVCGTSTFTQASVPICGGRAMPFRGCGTNSGLTDVNPFWYKFTCFQSGTLGFLITPTNLGDDYDWELYDITGRNPDDVYTDGGLVISNNWSGETGLTGASSSGTQTFVCGGGGKPLFSQMPQLVAGNNYLLLISHFTQTQSGYKLSFGGGTAVITDPTPPHLKSAEAACSGDLIRVKLNKKMKCSTIDPTGSEFYITPSGTVSSVTAIGCTTQFDTDSLLIKLTSVLTPGNYTLHIKNGRDGNTILDYCDKSIAETETLPFVVLPKVPTPMDSLSPVGCAPKTLKLVFKQFMLCSSIAADGSDFNLTGTYPVSITGASGTCSTDGLTKEIIINLSQSLQVGGSFQLTLKTGSDGNALINECTEPTSPGASITFTVKDTVNADFTYSIQYGCAKDSILFFHNGQHDVNTWNWSLDEGQQSNLQNPTGIYSIFNQKTVKLVVSNGVCKDSATKTILLDNFLKADFSVFEDNCPNESTPFTSTAVGKIVNNTWDFGDGVISTSLNPTHTYIAPIRQTVFSVNYTVTDSIGCTSTAQKRITVYPSCFLAVPTAFTPNGDGKNDVFGVANAVKAENLQFMIFNRWGQLVFKTTNWKQTWDGKVNGALAPTSVFVWILRYTDRSSKKLMEQKGTVALIR